MTQQNVIVDRASDCQAGPHPAGGGEAVHRRLSTQGVGVGGRSHAVHQDVACVFKKGWCE
jgi:hypothetical protein